MEELQAWLSTWLDPRVRGRGRDGLERSALAALAIFVIGRLFLRWSDAVGQRAMRRVGMDDTLTRFLGNLLYMVLLVFLVLTAFSALGVPTTNFLAIVGAAGLAVGLALKDSLSEFLVGRDARVLPAVQSRRSDRGGGRRRRRSRASASSTWC